MNLINKYNSDADLLVLLPPGHSVGTIRTRRPVMYVFSGGDEDAAFFSVNGFSLLLDGGDCKEVPFWNLIRNYDKSKMITFYIILFFIYMNAYNNNSNSREIRLIFLIYF